MNKKSTSAPTICEINFIYDCKAWKKVDFELKNFTKALAILIYNELNVFKKISNPEFSLSLADDAQLQLLNKKFLSKDSPTNVLSFPSHEIKVAEDLHLPDSYLGDIAISYTKIHQEALEQNKTFKNHYAHIIVHAILHLMGYDHQNSTDTKIMEKLEIKILNLIDIPNPYNI